MTELPTHPASPRARQETVDRLCAHFAADNLETAEFERRLDVAHRAQTAGELVALEQDLPQLFPQGETSAPVPAHSPSAAIDTTRPTRDRGYMLGMFASTKRTGDWTPPRHLGTVAVFGETNLDFRDVTFPAPEITVTAFTLFGETVVIVPPGVRVESNGMAVLGEFGNGPDRPFDPDAPTIRVRGLVILGEVTISERLPGETAKEAKKRLKAERRQLKADRKARRLRGEP